MCIAQISMLMSVQYKVQCACRIDAHCTCGGELSGVKFAIVFLCFGEGGILLK